ncbi:MAG: response regulator [Arcobacteraceae bacterium]|nr:response regulator [Arcobacteraceae bacterium]
MLDKNFLNKITILYVEDEEQIRTKMLFIFNKLFKKVIVAVNGQDGFDKFRLFHQKGVEFDVIISDINMPDMDGIEMLKNIRTLDKEIPIILTTAHSDARYFLDAIKLQVHHYAIKPIDMRELTASIQDATLKHLNNRIIKTTQLENQRYLDIINQVAIVSKTDLNGNITFVNDIFCEVSGYEKDELIGSNQRIVRHSDMPTILFDDLWNTLRAEKVWKGKIKNKKKCGDFYFVNSHIFPVFDKIGEEVIEYMAVRFLITEEEKEKRNFKQKVIKNIKDGKVSQQDLKKKIKELEFQLSLSGDIKIVFETLESEKRRSSKLLVQVKHYEELIKQKVEDEKEHRKEDWHKIDSLNQENKELLSKVNGSSSVIAKFKEEIIEQSNIINNINKENKEYQKRILELEDVIKFRETEIEVLKK